MSSYNAYIIAAYSIGAVLLLILCAVSFRDYYKSRSNLKQDEELS